MRINKIYFDKINNTSNLNFKRNILFIDMHTHEKSIEKLGKNVNPKDLLKFTQKNIEIDEDIFIPNRIIPSSLDCCFYENGKPYATELKGNEDILKSFSNTNIENFYAVCQPKTGSIENIKELFKKYPNKFIGLKFHPNGAELEADNALYDTYLDFAKKKNLPCLFHSDRSVDTTYKWIENGIEQSSTVLKSKYSRPEQIYALAKRHPDVPVIMAHFGGPEKDDIDATLNIILSSAKNKDAKIYADISWIDIDNSTKTMEKIKYIIKKLKNSEQGDLTDRILFGSDVPIDRFNSKNANKDYENFISGIHRTIKDNFNDDAEEIIDKIFYKNADELFFQKNWAKENVKNFSKIKLAALIGASVVVFCGLGILINKKIKNSKKQENILKFQIPDTFSKFRK